MTTYKELTGVLIKRQTTNPGDPGTGEVWYNNTTGNLSGLGVLKAWSSISPTITTGGNRGRFGTTASAIACGGEYTSVTATDATEEWSNPSYTIKTVTTS